MLSTGFQVALEKIKDEYGMFIFIDDNGKLFAGLRQGKNIGETVTYDVYKNVVEHDLKFRSFMFLAV